MKFNALSHLLQIHVTISISNLIILPVNIIWKKMYISVWRIKFTNTTFGHTAWIWISAWMDLCTVGFWHKCHSISFSFAILCVYISLFNLQNPSLVYINVHEYYLTTSSFLYTCSQFATFTFINIYVKIQLPALNFKNEV
jgi:hypothetical protein